MKERSSYIIINPDKNKEEREKKKTNQMAAKNMIRRENSLKALQLSSSED